MTLDEILGIPGNRPVFDDLQRLLAERNAIAFVGAGASAGMYPLWGDLIAELCKHAVSNGFASDADRQFWVSIAETKPAQVVRRIKQKLTSPELGSLLRSIFGPKPNGQRYTPTHAALLRVPFSGYITTNFDPGLVEARLAVRSSVRAVGFSTWQDDEINDWRDPIRLADPSWCPVLFAHGLYHRSDTIILGSGEYRRAYEDGPWRRLFEYLWSSIHLVFVGFGFSDPFLDYITGDIITHTNGQLAAGARHIAFIGAGTKEPYCEERRLFYLQEYGVRPIFYPVVGSDHGALLTLLDALAEISPPISPLPSTESLTRPLTAIWSNWVHETTNDNRFMGRDNELEQLLCHSVGDPSIRVIGICAAGGTGKTALVGHWLKNTTGWRTGPFAGVFAWSFYQERSSDIFLHRLLQWIHEVLKAPDAGAGTDLVPAALKLLQTYALIVVLDGLEVLQEGVEDTRYGAFLDGSLREFLTGMCARQHRSLAVLTSRFVFADLEHYLGTAFYQMELPGLAREQGAALLADLEVGGTEVARADVSRLLGGHPLGLRIFANVLPSTQRDQPRAFLDGVFRTGHLLLESPLADKIRRLIAIYQDELPLTQVRLLCVVGLFRAPVAEDTILRLAYGLFGRKRKHSLPNDATLSSELRELHARGVLTREPIDGGHGYSCHPILRDHFRSVLGVKDSATARLAANLLQGKPSGDPLRSAKAVEPVLLAIELLLDAGELGAADKLYQDRLEDGRFFLSTPALSEGLRCTLGFVRDEPRQLQCKEQLSQARLAFYLNAVGVFASLSGQYDLATHFHSQGNYIYRQLEDLVNLIHGLQNEAELFAFQGRLTDCANRATEALNLAKDLSNEKRIISSQAWRGWTRACSGYLEEAAEDFATANLLEKTRDSKSNELYSSRGTEWGELLFRTGHSALAALRTTTNLLFCARFHWNEDVARCHWVLGNCALMEGRFADAETELRQAEPTFHTGQIIFELARLHVTVGLVALARRDAATALHRAAEALALAQPRRMRLVHADALVLRGQARLLESAHLDALGRALDDAHDALRLARDCGYAWAERDALTLQADAHTAFAKAHKAIGSNSAAVQHRDTAHHTRTEANLLTARLHLTEEDLVVADKKAATWLKKWKRDLRGRAVVTPIRAGEGDME